MGAKILLVSVALLTMAAFASDGTVVVSPAPKDGFTYPALVLSGRLGQTWVVSGCEFISGLTCTIQLRNNQVHPARVYFVEFGANGEPISKDIRLIYPNLSAKEKGRATFRIDNSNPAKLVLRGEWTGPWQDPY